MKFLKPIIITVLAIASFSVNAQNSKDRRIMKDAIKAKKKLLKADSNLQSFFDDSAGYVIFPNVGKGGFIVGGASGNGTLFQNGEAVGKASLKKLNIGFQAGGQAVIEVIFFETKAALLKFKEGNFQFAAEASAVAVKSGIALNAKYKDEVAVFALPKAGLMADASVGGQKFSYTAY